VWWDAEGQDGIRHQAVHNTFGAEHAAAVHDAFKALLEGQQTPPARIPVLAASNWVGGFVGGWLGEEHSADWTGLKVLSKAFRIST